MHTHTYYLLIVFQTPLFFFFLKNIVLFDLYRYVSNHSLIEYIICPVSPTFFPQSLRSFLFFFLCFFFFLFSSLFSALSPDVWASCVSRVQLARVAFLRTKKKNKKKKRTLSQISFKVLSPHPPQLTCIWM